MKNKAKALSLPFVILSFFVFFFLSLFFLAKNSQVNADYPAPGYVISTVLKDNVDIINNYSESDGVGAVGHSILVQFNLNYGSTVTQILGRYIINTNTGWQTTSQDGASYSGVDIIKANPTYSSSGNYAVAGAWIYKDSTGQVKVASLSRCLRIFDRELKSFGTTRLTIPSGRGSVAVTGSRAYIGYVNGGDMSGNNNGFLPLAGWYVNHNLPSVAGGFIRGTSTTGAWNYGSYDYLSFAGPFQTYGISGALSSLPTQINFSLIPATFSAGQGTGAFADFIANNLVIYSRSQDKGTCGSMPQISIAASDQYYGKSQCEARVDTKKGWCLLNPALGPINPSNPNDPINTWKWSYFYIVYGSVVTQTPTAAPTVMPTPVPTIPPRPTATPTPAPRLNCQGQYFGKPQCDARASATYGSGGTCQLNPALGTINPSNPNDPVNYWKWSYCR